MRIRRNLGIVVPVVLTLLATNGCAGGQIIETTGAASPRNVQSPSNAQSPAQFSAFQFSAFNLVPAGLPQNLEPVVVYEPVLETVELAITQPEEAPEETVPDVLSADPEHIIDLSEPPPGLADSGVPAGELSVFDAEGAATTVIEPDYVFQTVAATWPLDAEPPQLQVRVRSSEGEWGEWFALADDGAAPDAEQQDLSEVRAGTDSLAFADSDAIQVATIGDASQADVAVGVELALIGIGEPNSAAVPDERQPLVSQAEPDTEQFHVQNVAAGTTPTIITRAQWGAAEPRGPWGVADSVKVAIVHHTAGSNNYTTQASAAQQIRNDQAYHQNGRGWYDIGYNFIVDKFGNIYEGAAGSIDQAKIGAHTAGFNTGTVGISMLGDYTSLTPPAVMVEAVARIIGWRLGSYGVPANGQATLVAGTTSDPKRFPFGSLVSTPTITAHRNLGATACPGDAAYAQLDTIRMRAVAQQATLPNQLPKGVVDSVTSSGPGQVRIQGWAYDPDTAGAVDLHIYVGGKIAKVVKADGTRTDVQKAFGLANAYHGFDVALTNQPLGPQQVCVWAINVPSGTNYLLPPGLDRQSACVAVTISEKGNFLGNQVTRLSGASREDTARVVAKALFAKPDTVFIATGGNYPDALAAAAAAQQAKAPLLLFGSDAENTKTLAYLKSLSGLTKVYVFGGQTAIPNSFINALKQIAPVERIAGADRYATAAKIATKFFPNATSAFVATGLNFPDALAAAAAAGHIGAPVLLVGADVASAAQAEKVLANSKINHIYLAGGPTVISEQVEKTLEKYGTIDRFAGADRYHTAAAIAGYFFPKATTAFVATGLNFPDALAGAAAGAQTGSPVLLTNPYQLGEYPKTYLTTTNKNLKTIYLLGGETALFPGTYPAK